MDEAVEEVLDEVRLSWEEREAKADAREEERLNLATAQLITQQQTSKLYERDLDERTADNKTRRADWKKGLREDKVFRKELLAVSRQQVKALNRLAAALESR